MQAVREGSLDRYALALKLKRGGLTHREIAGVICVPIHRVPLYLRLAEEQELA